uniref:DUF3999 domain-containing protein n=1 Tax=Desulfosarcina cetonica TaxID=90730 RepID=UPI0006D053E4
MRRWLCPLLLILLFIGCSALVGAADLTLNDFAYGLPIDVPEGTPVAALSLPEAVYTHARRPDLGDLRVFNAAGEMVPHLLRFARSQSAESPWQALPFFPLPAAADTASGGYGVYVQTGPNGALVRITPPETSASAQPSRDFLIDLSQTGRRLVQLRLAWPPDRINRMTTLAVEAGDDLVNWTSVQSRWSVTDIRYGSRRLINNTLSMKTTGRRYLRLRQLDDGPPLVLTHVEGRLAAEGSNPVRAFTKVKGQAVADTPGKYRYEIGGAFPVDRVNLVFDAPNSMADAILWSRPGPKAQWVRRAKALFYRIDVDGAVLTGDSRPVAVSTDRYWRLTVDASASTIGNAVPQLEIGYRPHDLYFIARGKSPFTLAFGSSLATPYSVNVAALFDGIGRQRGQGIERWVTPKGKPVVLGGPQRLAPQ